MKITYNVRVTTPKDIAVRVSGNLTSEITENDHRVTDFEMNIPIPSYLLAIVAGNLEERQIGPRTYVITEPENIEASATELEDLEASLIMAEEYLFPYVWGTYKIVIMPPSFPFGGMENPLLTFASPSIIVGDKSGVTVANHEIAHSWTGNLVTNMNWDNFFLNEGFTRFVERKLMR
jgi:leukotriene-A4 hydrolase